MHQLACTRIGFWNPQFPLWKRVEEEGRDAEITDGMMMPVMKIGPGPWAARKRNAAWQAGFAVEIAKCNAPMASR